MVNELRGLERIKLIGKQLCDEFNLEDANDIEAFRRLYTSFQCGVSKRKIHQKSKGILVIGAVGVGKSVAMKIIQRLFKDTSERFLSVSGIGLKDLSEVMPVSEIKNLYGFDLKQNLYIDDIGISIDVKRYGNVVNIISEILMDRYDLFVSEGYKTHISSNVVASVKENEKNKDVPTLEKIYGRRILDRLVEMNELIIWGGKSKRK